jgi:2-oxoglutarate dehydrogenase E2 component (dihydrolipoamide succinyltransferase)
VSGSLLATPIIINQPQSAILGIGKLEKRVCVADVNGIEQFVARPKVYVTLSLDHRALDGYVANSFLSHFIKTLEELSF